MWIVTSTAKRKTKNSIRIVIVIIINYINYMDKSIGTHLNQTHFHRYIKSTFTNKFFKKRLHIYTHKCIILCIC